MAVPRKGTQTGQLTDEVFAALEGLIPQKAVEALVFDRKALYWLRRRLSQLEGSLGGAGIGGQVFPVTFTPFQPPWFALFGIQDLTLVLDDPNIDLTTALGGNCVLNLTVAYVNEATAALLYARIASTGLADPLTVTPTITTLQSGLAFNTYDYIVWNDPNSAGGMRRAYEVGKIIGKTGSSWVVERHPTGAATGDSYFASPTTTHGDTLVYKVELAHFTHDLKTGIFTLQKPETPSGLQAEFTDVLPSACIVGYAAQLSIDGDVAVYTPAAAQPVFYPNPGSTVQNPPAPGFRTLTGAEYLLPLNGDLSIGMALPQRIPVSESTGIRITFGTVKTTPPVGTESFTGLVNTITNAAIVVYVLYVEPKASGLAEGDRQVALVEQVAIAENAFESFALDNPPEQRRMPYGVNGQTLTWPTTSIQTIGTISSVQLAVNNFLNGVTPTIVLALSGTTIPIQQGGEWDLLVAHVGTTTAGADFLATLQT